MCEDAFEREEKTGSTGGDGREGVDTLDKCKDECRDESGCLGFDWTLDDGEDIRCWIHTDEDKFEDSEVADRSDQYTRTDCKSKIMHTLT